MLTKHCLIQHSLISCFYLFQIFLFDFWVENISWCSRKSEKERSRKTKTYFFINDLIKKNVYISYIIFEKWLSELSVIILNHLLRKIFVQNWPSQRTKYSFCWFSDQILIFKSVNNFSRRYLSTKNVILTKIFFGNWMPLNTQ